jgi:hypothetical protein
MITLLADLVRRSACTARTAADAYPGLDSRRQRPPLEILTDRQTAPSNTVPYHEGRRPPPSPELTEPFKESLVALLIELAWRRVRASKIEEEKQR